MGKFVVLFILVALFAIGQSRKGNGSPKKDNESPEKRNDSPEKDDDSPEKDDGSPEKGKGKGRAGKSRKGKGSPEKDNESPEKRNDSPEKDDDSPEKDDGSPEKGKGKGRGGKSGKGKGSPEKDDDSPEKDDDSPEKDDGSPEKGKGKGRGGKSGKRLIPWLWYFWNLKRLCRSTWKEVYTNAADGTEVSGNKSALIQAVQAGSHVRVFMEEWGVGGYSTETNNMEVVGEGVCAQALFHISRGTQTFQNNAYWWFLKLCTTGNVHMARYNVGEAVNRGESRRRAKISWFVKDVCFSWLDQGPTFANDATGNTVSGDKNAFKAAVLKGYDVRAHSNGYTYPMDNLAVSSSVVSGQSVWHVSQRRVGNIVEFQPNAYWWFTITSTDGLRDVSRWTLGEHQDRGHNSQTTPVEWYADPCWKKVYSHDASGKAVWGSRFALVSFVKRGHRVRIVINKYAIEADNVRAIGGHVSAQLLAQVSKADIQTFEANADWVFQIVDTSGHVYEARYKVGEEVNTKTTVSSESVEWFVEARPWKKILETNDSGLVVSGSKEAVRDAIQKGASFRISPQFSQSGFYVASVNNLRMEANGEVTAMSLKHISMQRLGEPGARYKIEDNAYWRFLLINTQSRVETSKWTVGKHENRGRTSETATRVVWFVNY